MILSFKRQMPWGESTNFKQKIKAGVKIHTFRLGDRWKPGMIIHFWEENPRVKTKNTAAFRLGNYERAEVWKQCEYKEEGKERIVDEPLCFAVEPFELTIKELPDDGDRVNRKEVELKIGDLFIDTPEMLQLVAFNDGFNSFEEFISWFSIYFKKKGITTGKGQVIHWTDQVYDTDTADCLPKINF